MAGKKVQLLLNKTVESLGIVGDIVKVRPGFARNFLLPQRIAEKPTPTAAGVRSSSTAGGGCVARSLISSASCERPSAASIVSAGM